MLPEAYERFRDELTGLDPDRYPAWFWDRQIYIGFWRVWGSDKAVIVAELKPYPSGIIELHGVAAAGDLAAIVDLIPLAEAWGREAGAVRAVIESREGWARMLPEYEVHQVSVRKEL